MNLRIIYDPVLRRKAHPVELFDSALKNYATEMIEVMKSHNGLGLAAPQVGLDKRLIVLGYEPNDDQDPVPHIPLTILVNPRVNHFSKEKETLTEGCLSLPGLELPVTRSAGVTVTAQSLSGTPVNLKAKGLMARILQHEIDHLDGILFTDRADNYRNIADYRHAKIIFFGSDDFSLPVFRSLIEAKLNVIAVITETDKPAGRGQALQATPIKLEAELSGVAVFQPESKEEITAIIKQLSPDLIVLASYGKILPAETLSVPTFGALNVHPSLLPKYRGATPIQSAILSGETETGVTIMTMAVEVDAGALVAQTTEPIKPDDTTVTLRVRLAERGAKLLIESIPPYLAGRSNLGHQTESAVITTRKLTKEMGEIDWQKPLDQIDREIRAFQPWPGAFTELDGKRLKILGSYYDNRKLFLTNVQLEGKRSTTFKDFERGYRSALKKTAWYARIA